MLLLDVPKVVGCSSSREDHNCGSSNSWRKTTVEKSLGLCSKAEVDDSEIIASDLGERKWSKLRHESVFIEFSSTNSPATGTEEIVSIISVGGSTSKLQVSTASFHFYLCSCFRCLSYLFLLNWPWCLWCLNPILRTLKLFVSKHWFQELSIYRSIRSNAFSTSAGNGFLMSVPLMWATSVRWHVSSVLY